MQEPTRLFDLLQWRKELHPDVLGKMLMGEIINQHKDVFQP